jgi:fructose-1,6-bisphosphatase
MVHDDKAKQRDIDQAFNEAIANIKGDSQKDIEKLTNQEMIEIFKSVLKKIVPSEQKIVNVINEELKYQAKIH